MKHSDPAYQPSSEQAALLPETSGNTINGVDEPAPRRPSPVYWHQPERIPHGEAQKWMIARFNRVPALREVFARPGARGAEAPCDVAARREKHSAEVWTARAKAYALAHEADLVGIAAMDPLWVFEGYPQVSQPWIVVLGIAMDHARLARAPASDESPESALEVAEAYNRSARASRALAGWIHGAGYDAKAYAGPWAGAISLTPAALACGFGELGKHGNLINDRYGSSFRLAAVTTSLPLVADPPRQFGADEFCLRCQVCANACPPRAITHSKRLVRGVVKWYVDFDKCLPYFNETHGCGICIAVCPWSAPGRAPRLAERWARRAGAATPAKD